MGPVALLGAIVVPLTNALSVIVLEMGRSGRAEPKRLALSILKNPMVVAALAAIAASALPFRMPELLWGVVKDVAGVTTTISFISLGVGLNLGQARANRRPLFLGLALRMVLIPLIFLPLSVALGFRNHTVDFYNVLLYLSLPQFRDAVNGKTRKKCQTGGTIQALLSVCLSKGPALKIQKAAPCGRYSSNLPVKR